MTNKTWKIINAYVDVIILRNPKHEIQVDLV